MCEWRDLLLGQEEPDDLVDVSKHSLDWVAEWSAARWAARVSCRFALGCCMGSEAGSAVGVATLEDAHVFGLILTADRASNSCGSRLVEMPAGLADVLVVGGTWLLEEDA